MEIESSIYTPTRGQIALVTALTLLAFTAAGFGTGYWYKTKTIPVLLQVRFATWNCVYSTAGPAFSCRWDTSDPTAPAASTTPAASAPHDHDGLGLHTHVPGGQGVPIPPTKKE